MSERRSCAATLERDGGRFLNSRPRSSRPNVRFILWFSALLILAGCAESRPLTYPVSGTVEFGDLSPLTVGFVEFIPEETGPSARGKLDSRGHFVLGTFETADGAIAGDYRVVIVQHFTGTKPSSGEHDHAAEGASMVVDRRYSMHEVTPLSARVKPQENKVRLRVERAAAPQPRRKRR